MHSDICNIVFKTNPSKICGRQPLKNMKWYMVCLNRSNQFKFFKGCLSQILPCPSFNTLSHYLRIKHLMSSAYFMCKSSNNDSASH